MKQNLIGIISLCLLSFTIASAQKTDHSFKVEQGSFLYDGKPIQIHSGEMHFARIPQEYWRHRLKMAKAMGLNTIATYVFWNYHNPAPGVWDFSTGNHNLREFLKIAQEEGLMVILRPGPYVCAEWEFGGYPWWLLNSKDIAIRNNQVFLDSCKTYINKLAEQIKDFQVSKGGPIIMVQVENEFGSYVAQRKDIPMESHKQYCLSIKKMLTDAGLEGPFFTSDGSWLFDGGAIPGVLPTANGEDNIDNLKKAVNQYHNNEGPYMVAEFYPGWLDHWGEDFVKVPKDQVVTQTEKYLQNGINFNYYMVHGGTNFGFTAGANYDKDHDIQPDITSYDYDAPISEAGWATDKYLAIRDLMKKYVTYPVPEIPAQIPVITIPDIHLNSSVNLFDWKKNIKPAVSDKPLTFEELGQGQGYVLYSKRFTQPISGKLHVNGLRDFGIVYVNGKKIGELNRITKNYSIDIDIPFNGRLDILVENMGRINYGAQIPENKKGIISPITINDFEITGNWEMYRIPLDQTPVFSKTDKAAVQGLPVFYSGSFALKQVGDIFLDMRGWGKGIVFVNGHNLGRYWKIGPQQTLYLPGCWLKKGSNEVIIFEQQNDQVDPVLKTSPRPILEELKK